MSVYKFLFRFVDGIALMWALFAPGLLALQHPLWWLTYIVYGVYGLFYVESHAGDFFERIATDTASERDSLMMSLLVIFAVALCAAIVALPLFLATQFGGAWLFLYGGYIFLGIACIIWFEE